MTDWDDFRKCRACGSVTGYACVSRSGRIVDGRPDGVVTALPYPHSSRQRRAGR